MWFTGLKSAACSAGEGRGGEGRGGGEGEGRGRGGEGRGMQYIYNAPYKGTAAYTPHWQKTLFVNSAGTGYSKTNNTADK